MILLSQFSNMAASFPCFHHIFLTIFLAILFALRSRVGGGERENKKEKQRFVQFSRNSSSLYGHFSTFPSNLVPFQTNWQTERNMRSTQLSLVSRFALACDETVVPSKLHCSPEASGDRIKPYTFLYPNTFATFTTASVRPPLCPTYNPLLPNCRGQSCLKRATG